MYTNANPLCIEIIYYTVKYFSNYETKMQENGRLIKTSSSVSSLNQSLNSIQIVAEYSNCYAKYQIRI